MVEHNRRKGDPESWLKAHHLIASFLVIFVGLTAYVFTTFATISMMNTSDHNLQKEIALLRTDTFAQNQRIEDKLNEINRMIVNIIRENRSK